MRLEARDGEHKVYAGLAFQSQPVNTETRFYGMIQGKQELVAIIDNDGIFHIKIDPTDEATKQCIEVVNRHCNCELKGIKAE
mgnify:CR=1 FL=1